MATIVGAFGAPHGPMFPLLAAGGSAEADEVLSAYGALRQRLEAAQPDVLVVITCDHLTQFFTESVPIFSIAVGEHAAGPCDYRDMPQYEVEFASDLARRLQHGALIGGFDVGSSPEISLDHSITVPLHFLTPAMDLPVVPVYVNGFLPPLPLAQRCFDLGSNLGSTIAATGSGTRVAIVASGHVSTEIGGPRFYLPDPEWLRRVEQLLKMGDFATLVAEATPEQLAAAGNVAGELLTWLTMLGALGARAPEFIHTPPQRGVTFAAWSEAR